MRRVLLLAHVAVALARRPPVLGVAISLPPTNVTTLWPPIDVTILFPPNATTLAPNASTIAPTPVITVPPNATTPTPTFAPNTSTPPPTPRPTVKPTRTQSPTTVRPTTPRPSTRRPTSLPSSSPAPTTLVPTATPAPTTTPVPSTTVVSPSARPSTTRPFSPPPSSSEALQTIGPSTPTPSASISNQANSNSWTQSAMFISSMVVAGLVCLVFVVIAVTRRRSEPPTPLPRPHTGPRYLLPQGPDDVVLATATFGADASMHRRLHLALHVESPTVLDTHGTGAESQSPGSEIFATGDWDAYVQRTQAEHII